MNHKQSLYLVLFVLLTGGTWQACNKSDIDNAQLGSHTADFAFPLFTTDLKLKDLLVNVLNDTLSGDTIFVNPDNTMTLFYSGDVAQKPASDIFDQLTPGGFTFNDSVLINAIPGPSGVVIRRAELRTGTLYFTMKNSTADTLHGYFEVPQMTVNSTVVRTAEFLIAPGKSWNSGIVDVATADLESPDNLITFKYYAYKSDGTRVRVPSPGFLDVGVLFGNLSFDYLEGNWGNETYQLTRDTIEIDINQTELDGNIKVTNPQVTMRILNSWGFPTRGVIKYMSFIGQNGEVIPLTSTVFQKDNNGQDYVDFAYPSWSAGEVGQTKYTDVYLDNTNSNIADIFNSQPTRLIYEVDGVNNATSDPNIVGFITGESVISLQLKVELVLEGSAKNFGAEQDLDLNFDGLGSLDSANISSVEFKLVAENGTPIDINAQIYFRDEAGNNVDSLFDGSTKRIMEAAPVNSQGVAEGITRTETFIPMESARFENIRLKTKSGFLKAYFTTAEDGEKPVKLLADNKTTLKMGIRVKKLIE